MSTAAERIATLHLLRKLREKDTQIQALQKDDAEKAVEIALLKTDVEKLKVDIKLPK